jgi:hypothetical protein
MKALRLKWSNVHPFWRVVLRLIAFAVAARCYQPHLNTKAAHRFLCVALSGEDVAAATSLNALT